MRKPAALRRRTVRVGVVALAGVLVGVVGYLAYLRLSAPGPRPAPGWTLLAELPNPRGESATAVAGGKVYVVGGFAGLGFETTAEVSVYDPVADAWSTGPALPEPRNHPAAASLDGMVYVSGGAAPSGEATDTLWALEPGAATWTALRPMPAPRSAHRLLALDGRLFAVGGVGGPVDGPGAAGRLLVYDPASDSWSEGAALPVNRDHLAAVVADGEIWAIGGRAGGGNHALVDIYDGARDAWRQGPPLPEPTSGAADAFVGGVVYISAGEDPGRGAIVDRHWRLDTLGALAWTALPPPPLAIHGVAGVDLGGRFAIVGGSTRPGGQSNTAWTGATQVFDPGIGR